MMICSRAAKLQNLIAPSTKYPSSAVPRQAVGLRVTDVRGCAGHFGQRANVNLMAFGSPSRVLELALTPLNKAISLTSPSCILLLEKGYVRSNGKPVLKSPVILFSSRSVPNSDNSSELVLESGITG